MFYWWPQKLDVGGRFAITTRSSAIAEGPRDALRQLKSGQLLQGWQEMKSEVEQISSYGDMQVEWLWWFCEYVRRACILCVQWLVVSGESVGWEWYMTGFRSFSNCPSKCSKSVGDGLVETSEAYTTFTLRSFTCALRCRQPFSIFYIFSLLFCVYCSLLNGKVKLTSKLPTCPTVHCMLNRCAGCRSGHAYIDWKWRNFIIFTARRYASAVYAVVVVCPSARPSARLSHAGIVRKTAKRPGSRKQRCTCTKRIAQKL